MIVSYEHGILDAYNSLLLNTDKDWSIKMLMMFLETLDHL